MSDENEDRQRQPATPPPAEPRPHASAPFVQNDDTANMRAIHARPAARQAVIETNSQVFPSLVLRVNTGRTLQFVDFGFSSARQYWEDVVLRYYTEFMDNPAPATAMTSAHYAWTIHEWLWHDQHSGQNTRGNTGYEAFQKKILNDCPELGWVRDIDDASKHRGLSRASVQVNKIPRNSTPLRIGLNDGTEYDLADVLSIVIKYWSTTYFS
jgi:hypothetical protein